MLLELEHKGVEAIKSSLFDIELSEKQIQILSFLRELQLNFYSFVANDLNMVLLCEELKIAARTKSLGCHLAKILNQLQVKKLNCREEEAMQIRLDATHKVIQENLNESHTRKMVSNIIQERSKLDRNTDDISEIKEVYQNTKQNLNKLLIKELKPRQLKSLKKIMEQKLIEIERQLENSTMGN